MPGTMFMIILVSFGRLDVAYHPDLNGTVGVPRFARDVTERTCVCPSTTLRIQPFGPGRA